MYSTANTVHHLSPFADIRSKLHILQQSLRASPFHDINGHLQKTVVQWLIPHAPLPMPLCKSLPLTLPHAQTGSSSPHAHAACAFQSATCADRGQRLSHSHAARYYSLPQPATATGTTGGEDDEDEGAGTGTTTGTTAGTVLGEGDGEGGAGEGAGTVVTTTAGTGLGGGGLGGGGLGLGGGTGTGTGVAMTVGTTTGTGTVAGATGGPRMGSAGRVKPSGWTTCSAKCSDGNIVVGREGSLLVQGTAGAQD